MKIVVLGGYAKSLINFRGPLLLAMVKLGHEVIGCGPEEDGAVKSELAEMGIGYEAFPLHRAGLNPVQDVGSLAALVRLLKRTKPDMVFSYAIKPVIYGSIAARICRIPRRRICSMITGLGSTFAGGNVKKRIVARFALLLYRLGMRCNGVVFFQNRDDRDFFQRSKLLDPNIRPVIVNGSGVDLDAFAQVPAVVEPISFLLIARLLKSKGIPEYVEAAKVVKRRYPQVEFRLAGPLDPNPDAILKTELDDWKQSGTISYLGMLRDVRPELARTSVFVLPSYYGEGIPRTILEAMAMGKPIITANTPGCRETVQDGWNGFLVPARDPTALSDVMQRFIETPGLIAEMGNNSRALAAEKFDVEIVNRRMLDEMHLSFDRTPHLSMAAQ